MLNWTLLRHDIRRSWKLWFIFTALMLLCAGIALSFYDPVKGLKDTAMLDSMSGSLVRALGIDLQDGSLTGHISSYLFGFCYLLIPLAYAVIFINYLLTFPVQNGMMAYYLSMPEPRNRVIFVKAYLFCVSLLGMFLITGGAGALCCAIWYPGSMEVPQYILLWLGAYLLHLCLGGIVFFVACICDEVKTSVMIGAGLPVLFLLVHLMGRTGGSLKALQHLTPFALFSPQELLSGDLSLYWKLPLAGLIGMLCFFAGGTVFKKKDLPL